VDPVTLALIAAIAAGAAKGVSQVVESAVTDGYRGLKQLLARKFGHDSDVVKAIESAEEKPESEGRKNVLREEIAASGAEADPEILAAARQLLAQLSGPAGDVNVQQAHGSYIAQAGAGGHAEVHVATPPDPPGEPKS
jgi:hypothetical protein